MTASDRSKYNPPSTLPEIDAHPCFRANVEAFGRNVRVIGQHGFSYYTCQCTRTRGGARSRDYDTIVVWRHNISDTHHTYVDQCPYCQCLLLEDGSYIKPDVLQENAK